MKRFSQAQLEALSIDDLMKLVEEKPVGRRANRILRIMTKRSAELREDNDKAISRLLTSLNNYVNSNLVSNEDTGLVSNEDTG